MRVDRLKHPKVSWCTIFAMEEATSEREKVEVNGYRRPGIASQKLDGIPLAEGLPTGTAFAGQASRKLVYRRLRYP